MKLWKYIWSIISGIFSLLRWAFLVLMLFFIIGSFTKASADFTGTSGQPLNSTYTEETLDLVQSKFRLDFATQCHTLILTGLTTMSWTYQNGGQLSQTATCIETNIATSLVTTRYVNAIIIKDNSLPDEDPPTLTDICWERYTACSSQCAGSISSFTCPTNICNCVDTEQTITYVPNTPDSNGATIQTVVDAVNASHEASTNIANTTSEIKSLTQASNVTLLGIESGINKGSADIVSAIQQSGGGGAGGSVTVDLNPTNAKLDKIIENQEKLDDMTDKTKTSYAQLRWRLDNKLQSIAIVQAYQNFSLDFGGNSNCSMPSGSFNLMGKNMAYDFNNICDMMNQISSVLGAMMLFLYSFVAAKVAISA